MVAKNSFATSPNTQKYSGKEYQKLKEEVAVGRTGGYVALKANY